MKKLFYLAAIACMALLSSCEGIDADHTGDDTGNLYGIWQLTTKNEITKDSEGKTTSTKEVDYTKVHFYLTFGEFPFPHAIAKKGSLSSFDLDDVDVDAVKFSYNADEKKIYFPKTIWLSDEILTYNMLLKGTFDVLELTKNKFVIQQTVLNTTTIYSYQKQNNSNE